MEITDYDKNNPIITCSNENCRTQFCFVCKESWHYNMTCSQFQEWKEKSKDDEILYNIWKNENAKSCPDCKNDIQKNGGCNKMSFLFI
jgi:hypothetical protein